MIKRESFSKEHIQNLVLQSGRDPIILERTVYAFGLLEALARVGMPFVFKGGTCLMLLLEKPQRLSTDIDIIVEPGTDLQEYLDKAAEIFPFKCVDEQERKGKNDVQIEIPLNSKGFLYFAGCPVRTSAIRNAYSPGNSERFAFNRTTLFILTDP